MNSNALTLDDIILLVVAVFVAIFLLRLTFGSIKKIIGLVINSIFGAILLMIVNYFGSYFGITVGINILTALIAGVLGIPGVILIVLFQMFI